MSLSLNDLVCKRLKDLNYEIVKNDGTYIEAFSTHNPPTSVMKKRKLNINLDRDGYIYISIKEDWDTRIVFNGRVKNIIDIEIIHNSTLIL